MMASPGSGLVSSLSRLSSPYAVVAVAIVNLAILAAVVSVFGPREKQIAANGQAMCGHFYSLVKDVRAGRLSVPVIRANIDKLEAESLATDGNIRYSTHYFVHAAREAVSSYFVYPTFDVLAYSDTYEHMMIHEMTYQTSYALTKTCTLEGFPDKSAGPQESASSLQTFLAEHQNHAFQPSSDASVKDATQALAAVQGYLGDKPWGYFGARCDMWATMHYRLDKADATYLPADKEWVVDVLRREEALGPVIIRYHVNAYTGVTLGDASNHVNSFFAEGCDAF
jgi:hypothetical protein